MILPRAPGNYLNSFNRQYLPPRLRHDRES